jgi:hypothetical protein
VRKLAVTRKTRADLVCQFSRRSEDQSPNFRTTAPSPFAGFGAGPTVREELLEGGNGERGGLAGACLSAPNQVSPLEDSRNGL